MSCQRMAQCSNSIVRAAVCVTDVVEHCVESFDEQLRSVIHVLRLAEVCLELLQSQSEVARVERNVAVGEHVDQHRLRVFGRDVRDRHEALALHLQPEHEVSTFDLVQRHVSDLHRVDPLLQQRVLSGGLVLRADVGLGHDAHALVLLLLGVQGAIQQELDVARGEHGVEGTHQHRCGLQAEDAHHVLGDVRHARRR